MTHPSWFVRIQTLGLGMKSIQHQPSSLVLHGSLVMGRNGRNLCKSLGLHPSFKPTPPHYTRHSAWGNSHLNPTSLASVYGLPPPTVGESTWIILYMGHHPWLWSHVWLNEYSWVHWALRRKYHGTQPGEWHFLFLIWISLHIIFQSSILRVSEFYFKSAF